MGLVDFKSINNCLTVNPKVGGDNPVQRVVQQSPLCNSTIFYYLQKKAYFH